MTTTLEYMALGPVMSRYRAVLLDLWGVVHNGVAPHPGALAFIDRCRSEGIAVGLLSNAPRRVSAVARMLERKFDLAPARYDLLMTSGEDCWLGLQSRDQGDGSHRLPGVRGYFLGVLPTDQSMREGLAVDWVEDVAEADFLLNCGPQGATTTVADFLPLLERALAAQVPMLCANPDRFVHRGDSLEICAGALAEQYEKLGGLVRWHGKPHSNVYRRCFAGLEALGVAQLSMGEILMVGDSFITDIKGAVLNGMDSALITSGLYREDIARDGVAALATRFHAAPTYALPALVW